MGETYHLRGKLVDGYPVGEHPIYRAWASMKERCNSPDQVSYLNYGARGITYCCEWAHFENFARDMFPSWREGLTLERNDSNKNYDPDNCTWADRTQQCHNRRKFKNNTTGFPGVVLTRSGNFEVRWDNRGKRHQIGRFNTAQDAAEARRAFIEEFQKGTNA